MTITSQHLQSHICFSTSLIFLILWSPHTLDTTTSCLHEFLGQLNDPIELDIVPPSNRLAQNNTQCQPPQLTTQPAPQNPSPKMSPTPTTLNSPSPHVPLPASYSNTPTHNQHPSTTETMAQVTCMTIHLDPGNEYILQSNSTVMTSNMAKKTLENPKLHNITF